MTVLDHIYLEAKEYSKAVDKYEVYRVLKLDIIALNLPPAEYETAVRKLATITGV